VRALRRDAAGGAFGPVPPAPPLASPMHDASPIECVRCTRRRACRGTCSQACRTAAPLLPAAAGRSPNAHHDRPSPSAQPSSLKRSVPSAATVPIACAYSHRSPPSQRAEARCEPSHRACLAARKRECVRPLRPQQTSRTRPSTCTPPHAPTHRSRPSAWTASRHCPSQTHSRSTRPSAALVEPNGEPQRSRWRQASGERRARAELAVGRCNADTEGYTTNALTLPNS
jgi:hypothetical protein